MYRLIVFKRKGRVSIRRVHRNKVHDYHVMSVIRRQEMFFLFDRYDQQCLLDWAKVYSNGDIK